MKNVITMHEAAEALWNRAGQIVQSKAYQHAKKVEQEQPHPSPEMLYDFVLDDLDVEAAHQVRMHLTYCPDCANEVLAIMRIEEDAAQEDKPLAIPLESINAPISESIALEYWEPRYAGMELVAADMARQEHKFQEGQIKINTYWEGARDDKPAYIWVGWEVHVQPPYHLHLRFIVPETGHILYEVNLGQTERNSESFKADELHFDPTTTRFGIVAFTETPL